MNPQNVLPRTELLDPEEFLGQGYSFWRGPTGGNGLDGEIEQDNPSVAPSEFNTTKVRLVSMLHPGETLITGEETRARLKEARFVPLGAYHLLAFLRNKDRIPELFKERVNGEHKFIYFDGIILRDPGGKRCSLTLCFDGNEFYRGVFGLHLDRGSDTYSAILE